MAASNRIESDALINVDQLLTPFAKALSPGSLKTLVASAGENSIGMHGGLPPPECFPLSNITVTLATGETIQIDASLAQQQYNIVPPGLPSLRNWAINHVQHMHSPKYSCDVAITGSSSHALDLLTSILLSNGKDRILVEEYTYSHFVDCICRPRELDALPVAMDKHGIMPEALERVLSQCKATCSDQHPMPKLLYTVPIGQNPTGCCTTLERKKEIYDICRKYDVLILEDDPYGYIQYGDGLGGGNMPGLKGLKLESYLSIDIDGRVIRLDSFAKSLAPGYRLGWISGHPKIIERVVMATQASTIGANNFCQVIVSTVLSAWGDDGLDRHLKNMQATYAKKAAVMNAAAERELKGLVEWEMPHTGMYMWFKVLGIKDVMEIYDDLCKGGVVACPGHIFAPPTPHDSIATTTTGEEGKHRADCPYLRFSFSKATVEEIEEGIRRMGAVLRAKLGTPHL